MYWYRTQMERRWPKARPYFAFWAGGQNLKRCHIKRLASINQQRDSLFSLTFLWQAWSGRENRRGAGSSHSHHPYYLTTFVTTPYYCSSGQEWPTCRYSDRLHTSPHWAFLQVCSWNWWCSYSFNKKWFFSFAQQRENPQPYWCARICMIKLLKPPALGSLPTCWPALPLVLLQDLLFWRPFWQRVVDNGNNWWSF